MTFNTELWNGQAPVAGVYEIERSLRFNSADSSYLSKTFASAGNRKTWTMALWVKRSAFGASQTILSNDIDFGFYFDFDSGDSLRVLDYGQNTGLDIYYVTSAVYRDPSAWYHIVVSIDTTNTTAADRVKIYVNGSRLTEFSASTTPPPDYLTKFNSTQVNAIGRNDAGSGNWHFNGYLADIHFIDGQALDPTSFGAFDATTGVWNPIAYTGSFPGNSFHLDFADNSSAAALGYDAAGSNDWTVNNLSVTAGAGNDSLVDSPTNYGEDTGAGGEVRGNYCTMSPLQLDTITLANGNLDINRATGGSWKSTIGTLAMPTSGKWYFEATLTGTALVYVGLVAADAAMATLVSSYPVNTQTAYTIYSGDSNVYSGPGNNNGGSSGLGSFSTGDVVRVLYDADNGNLKFGKNSTLMASNAYTGLNTRDYLPVIGTNPTGLISVNFGQRPFAYTAPSGYTALCTQNLPAPTIENGSTAMDVVTYTGTGSALTPTSSLNFSPDLIWLKSRSAATNHALYDIVRGVEKRLESSSTGAEVTSDSGVTAFNSNGFTLGTLAQVNTSSATYVGWCWDGGSSNVTNTDGSITSTVRANASAGISVVSWTGSNGTVGHGLGKKPDLIITKIRNTSSIWPVQHSSIGTNILQLQDTGGAAADSSNRFNNTAATSSVFTAGSWWNPTSQGIAYCFAPISGFSIMGKYTGNGNSDGPFVYTGFRSAFVLVKMSSSSGNWTILDSFREGYNVDNDPLYPNLSDAEGTTNLIDITSNGFKVRTTDATFNTNAGTYVYACFAENPFSLARAR